MDIVDRIFKKASEKFPDDKSFANAINVKPQRVSEWKLRKSASYVKRLEIISEKLETTPQYLLLGEEPESEKENVPESDTLSEEDAQLLRRIHALSPAARGKLLGYLDALSE